MGEARGIAEGRVNGQLTRGELTRLLAGQRHIRRFKHNGRYRV